MELKEKLDQQRIKHIVSSYQLDGDDPQTFNAGLNDLLKAYPLPLIELALVETLVDVWLTVPLVRGNRFLARVQAQLRAWEGHDIVSAIAPEQFQQITGLDPTPIFGAATAPLPQSPNRSLPY